MHSADPAQHVAPSHAAFSSDAHCTELDGRVYVAGGFDGKACHDSAECFDPHLNRWARVRSPMAHRRSGVGSVTLEGRSLLVVGGFSGRARLASSERLDPREGRWHALKSMHSPR